MSLCKDSRRQDQGAWESSYKQVLPWTGEDKPTLIPAFYWSSAFSGAVEDEKKEKGYSSPMGCQQFFPQQKNTNLKVVWLSCPTAKESGLSQKFERSLMKTCSRSSNKSPQKIRLSKPGQLHRLVTGSASKIIQKTDSFLLPKQKSQVVTI